MCYICKSQWTKRKRRAIPILNARRVMQWCFFGVSGYILFSLGFCLFVCLLVFVCFLLDHLFAQMCDLKLHGSLMYCSTRENCLMSETL